MKFTLIEGSFWINWTKKKPTINQLKKKKVHSFMFSDGTEWDCINGMRNV